MKNCRRNVFYSIFILCISFMVCLVIQNMFSTQIIPAIFVLAVFLISLTTEGYIWGTISALISVLAVNYAFTFPVFKFNFTIPENLVSAIIMIIVTVLTSMLTTKIKYQEVLKAESEKERMRANLLRAVSHDLRTPLTTIYGSSSAILDNYSVFSDEQKLKMLGGIKEESEWLTRMVENLLSITRIDVGNVRIIKTPVVLEELVDSVLHKFRKHYPAQNVELDIPDDFITIPMDAILIEQVIFNILDNTMRHAKGMTEIHFRVSVNDEKAIFEISDNGCGIESERLKNIFMGYAKNTDTPTDTRSNAGIGLSVCATIVKAHGGIISADNNDNGGAMFRFSLNMEDNGDE